MRGRVGRLGVLPPCRPAPPPGTHPRPPAPCTRTLLYCQRVRCARHGYAGQAVCQAGERGGEAGMEAAGGQAGCHCQACGQAAIAAVPALPLSARPCRATRPRPRLPLNALPCFSPPRRPHAGLGLEPVRCRRHAVRVPGGAGQPAGARGPSAPTRPRGAAPKEPVFGGGCANKQQTPRLLPVHRARLMPGVPALRAWPPPPGPRAAAACLSPAAACSRALPCCSASPHPHHILWAPQASR